MLFSCPKQGTVLPTQNLKSNPQRRAALSRQTAAIARNALHSTSRPAAVFLGVCLAGIAFLWPEGLQLQDPRSVLKLVARVKCGIIRRLVANHGSNDFEPAHSQAA